MRSSSYRRLAVLTALALTGLGGAAESQSLQRLSLQGSGAALFATKTDANFDSKTGLGYEVQARYTFSRFSIGAGYQRSTVFSSPTLDLNLVLSLGFIEPRYVVTAGSMVAVYLAGRLGAGKLVCSEECQARKTNLSYGGGGGLLFKVSRRVSLDLGGQYFQVSGDLSSGYGMIRAGLGIGL
jgi:opacity protein-like surface antigen